MVLLVKILKSIESQRKDKDNQILLLADGKIFHTFGVPLANVNTE